MHGVYETMPYIHIYCYINVFNVRHILLSSTYACSKIHVFEFKLTDKSLRVGKFKYEYSNNAWQMKYCIQSI